MEAIFIGKPAMNVYLSLKDKLNEGDVFSVDKKNESLGNVSATAAIMFSKWKLTPHFQGVLGNDGYGEKIKNIFSTYKVNTKYLETDFTTSTATNYIIVDEKNGVASKIIYNDPTINVTKFKFDFLPDICLMDGTDIPGAIGFLNNYGTAKSVLYANILDKELITISKRTTYVVCSQLFAEAVSKVVCDGTVEGYINLYQKVVDVTGKSNYIVILNNHKILYSIDGQVKMLPEAKMNVVDSSSFDSIFAGTFTYAIANEIGLDDAIKLANTSASLSLARIGEADAIPEFDDVLDNSGLREKLGMSKPTYAPVSNNDLDGTVGEIAQKTYAESQDDLEKTQVLQPIQNIEPTPNVEATSNIEMPQPTQNIETPVQNQYQQPSGGINNVQNY